jgi:hypothetical protein
MVEAAVHIDGDEVESLSKNDVRTLIGATEHALENCADGVRDEYEASQEQLTALLEEM